MQAKLAFLAIAFAALLATAAIAQRGANPSAEAEAGIRLVELAGAMVLPAAPT